MQNIRLIEGVERAEDQIPGMLWLLARDHQTYLFFLTTLPDNIGHRMVSGVGSTIQFYIFEKELA